MSGSLDRFKTVFNQLNRDNLPLLGEIYTSDVRFRDPVHALDGLPALRNYYGRLYVGVVSCHFDFEAEVIQGQQGMLAWVMRFQHARFRAGETLGLRGASHLQFLDDGRVHYHRDYFDMGEFIYERVPVLGGIIRAIKNRL
ncbi:MAG: nuclear transport factor 2 family protein [Candidatus Competibacter sp.]|nr:nuclear transport factor 2 family protein [Candidatus Competibacter sp.]